MPDYAPAPTYPNYASFLSNLIGGLPTDYRAAQLQQGSVDVQNAFKGGVPTNPDGTPNYAAALQTLAKAGDPGAVAALGPAAQTQAWQQGAPGTMSPMLSGGAGTPAAPPPAAPMQLPSAPAQPPAAATPQPQPQPQPGAPQPPTLAALVSSVAPDPAKGAAVTKMLANILGVDPTAPLTPEQVARAQRIMAAAKLKPGGPGQLSAPVRWDLMDTGGGTMGAGQLADSVRGQLIDSGQASPASAPRGLRNNNPGNLESNAWTASLPGYEGSDGRFAVFDSAADGNAALDRNLLSYARQGVSTPRTIAAKWAPGSEAANNPASYGASIASALGVGQNDKVDLSDPDTRAKIAKAITRVENGPAEVASGGGGAPVAQGGGNRPIVPQVPLPPGITDPQQAILAIDREIAKVSTNPNPYAQKQIPALQDWRDRIAESVAPMKVGLADTLLDPRTGRPTYQGPLASGQGTLSPAALDDAAETALKTGKPPANIGRGVQGAQNLAAVYNRAAELAAERGIDPQKLADLQQGFNARPAGLRSVFQRATGLTLVENEANRLIPRVRELLPKLDHTQYPTINAAINAYEKATGDPNIVKFGISAASLANVYARVLKGGGTPTGGETDHARELLDQSWSAGQINAALDQIGVELQSAKQSTDDTLEEFGLSMKDIPGAGFAPQGGASPTAAPAQSAPSGGAGQPVKVTKEQYDALPKGAPFIAVDDPTQTPRTKP